APGLAGDDEVGELVDTGGDDLAGDVDADGEAERVVGGNLELVEGDRRPLGRRDLDADVTRPGDWVDAHTLGGDGEGDVVGPRGDGVGRGVRAELERVAVDGRAGVHLGDLGNDVEPLEG